jgi:RNA polymerase sigma-70 factor, ECF subfamily
MAVGQKRSSRLEGTQSPAARSADGGSPAAAIDGLLPLVASGDAEAFAGVYDLVAGAVYGLASRITGDQSRAEQVASEVLLEVWQSAARFSPAEGSGLSWIMTIARRRAMSHAAASDSHPAALGPAGKAEVMAGQGTGGLLAHRGLACLPGPEREAVVLASCGYTWQQAADLGGVRPGTMAERLRDGLLRLSSHPALPVPADLHESCQEPGK